MSANENTTAQHCAISNRHTPVTAPVASAPRATAAGIEERDACAIVALVDKRGHSTHGIIVKAIAALKKMGHRSGDINGEGDGCGIAIDIPRQIWARRLAQAGTSAHLADSSHFAVGHFIFPAAIRNQAEAILGRVRALAGEHGLDIVADGPGRTRDDELGPRARAAAPLFWQLAGLVAGDTRRERAAALFRLQMAIEKAIPEVHIASLSLDSAVYKLQGAPELLPLVFPELQDEACRSVMALGHGRYSTNTLPTVERSQPFSILGHNGEINTIERLRTCGRALGIEPVPGGSDSQDLNRIIDGLIHLYDFDPMEALELVFPAVESEAAHMPEEIRQLYRFYRWFFPASAQGPAAVVARYGNVVLGSVDALGLRPLWFGESDYNLFLSSEKGVVPLERTMVDPRPLAPGEKIAIIGGPGLEAEFLDCTDYQARLAKRLAARHHAVRALEGLHDNLPENGPRFPLPPDLASAPPAAGLLAAYGWTHYDLTIRERVSKTGREVIGSMGHTGPLANFVPEALPNLADFAKENVAVVTNPAIDREREAEHFSTATIIGSRPGPTISSGSDRPMAVRLATPLILEAAALAPDLAEDEIRGLAREFGTATYEDLMAFFTAANRDDGRVCFLDATFDVQGSLAAALEEAVAIGVDMVREGAVLVVLDDRQAFGHGRAYIDPALLVARLNEALIAAGLRRQTGIVVRSGAIRNLHDIMFLLGLGADGLVPTLLWRVALSHAGDKPDAGTVVRNNLTVLQKGIEKVMSTMGIHELCGYGRIFATIGLTDELSRILAVPNFCGSTHRGLTFAQLEAMARDRVAKAADEAAKIYRPPARNPRVGKILRKVALGRSAHLELAEELAKIDAAAPTGVRHLLDFRRVAEEQRPAADQVDVSVGNHDLPLVIAAMSFGSQGENSFRAYAEAAVKANIVCMNGEGGEIPDMLGRYYENRGQQLASGRFGVFMGFLNSARFLEIKIGQGAKPGEGGHLPGTKVTEIVGRARHCKPGITLISPSNHHDIYSIEDLAQIITELKTANPEARVSVKIPITAGVGTIAVGIAKAGADIINLSGFEGGTGAAREHAKRFVGLPAEIGVAEAHKALLASCLRDQVELWVDGGMRSGADVVKMILLGANRVGMGTVALMGVGCISCERCHLDRCPRGISTQLRTKEDAESRGVKGFSPRVTEEEAENLARLLRAIGDEIRMHTAALGATDLQALVGRTDLLVQVRHNERLSADALLAPPASVCNPDEYPMPQVIRKPLNYLTTLISDLAMERFAAGRRGVHFTEEAVRSTDRAVGTYLAGAIVRSYGSEADLLARISLRSSVPGNGLCAFNTPQLRVLVEGGAQDGAAKGAIGGELAILKGRNLRGQFIDGSTGKSFAYGAIGGLLIVQNMSDSRACIRLSGADAVFGGRITKPVRDELGNIASRAHLKGFAFEYMTGGRVVVLGDPGPWICAGMTGGVVYQCLYPELAFDRRALERRLARGANVTIQRIDDTGLADVRELLGRYLEILAKNFQDEEATAVRRILDQAEERFVAIIPKALRPVSAE